MSIKDWSKMTNQMYIITRRDCNDVYIRQTVEHKRSVRYGQENSSIFQHVQKTGHVINLNNSSVIYKTNCNFLRKIVKLNLLL